MSHTLVPARTPGTLLYIMLYIIGYNMLIPSAPLWHNHLPRGDEDGVGGEVLLLASQVEDVNLRARARDGWLARWAARSRDLLASSRDPLCGHRHVICLPFVSLQPCGRVLLHCGVALV